MNTKKACEQIPKTQDEYLINFLKEKGYRPKSTKKYLLGLIKRLKRKNKMIIFSSCVDYNYKKQKDASKDNLVIEGTLKMIAKIKDIENEFDKEFVKNQIKNLKGE